MMKHIIYLALTVIFFSACGVDEKESMLVSGEVKGLKKGTLYLQKMKDTTIVSVDSIIVDGVGVFNLSDEIESPEVYYLTLGSDTKKRIPFFGEEGEIKINTKLDKFIIAAKIEGQKNQQLLDEYNEVVSRFSEQNLELIKAEFESRGDSLKLDSVLSLKNNLIKRRYLYTTNFAVTNADAELAPYLAITELYNANIKLLDTIQTSLTDEVKTSKYGKQLEEFIADIKSKE